MRIFTDGDPCTTDLRVDHEVLRQKEQRSHNQTKVIELHVAVELEAEQIDGIGEQTDGVLGDAARRVQNQGIDDLAESDGCKGQKVEDQLRGRICDDRTDNRSKQCCNDHRQQDRQMEIHVQHDRAVCADGKECRMTHGYLTAVAEVYVKTGNRDDVQGREAANQHTIAEIDCREKERKRKQHDRNGNILS